MDDWGRRDPPKKKWMKNWVKVAISLIVIAFLFANPTTRAVIGFFLPLGSGVDDIIELVVLIALGVLLVCKIIRNKGKILDWFRDNDEY